MLQLTNAAVLALTLAACQSGPKVYYEGPEPVTAAPDAPAGTTPTTTPTAEPVEPPKSTVKAHVKLATPAAAASYLDAAKRTIEEPWTRVEGEMTRCYETELAFDATLAGTVTAKLTVDANGVITKLVASGVDENVANCIGGVIEGLKFSATGNKKPADVTYKFELYTSK